MIARLLKWNLGKRSKYLLVFGLALATWLFQQSPVLVEQVYTNGFYKLWSRIMQTATGFIPFSVGDVLYAAVFTWLLITVVSYIIRFARQVEVRQQWKAHLLQLAYTWALVWLVFQWGWGLNYHRAGSAYQLGLQTPDFNKADLLRLTDTLNGRLEKIVAKLQPNDTAVWHQGKQLRKTAVHAYDRSLASFSFLGSPVAVVKPSLYSAVGGYMGFSGYFNPFSGEGQIVTNIPAFQQPFTICHEMAHQQGYAAEQEANLIGFLVSAHHPSPAFRYSAYHDMLTYTMGELRRIDSVQYKQKLEWVPTLVKQHGRQARAYAMRHQHAGMKYIDAWYDWYLKWNKQDRGLESYSYVTAWLIAYANKYGWDKL